MKCLIIGDGPSKSLIDMNKDYGVDIICVHYPMHKFTKYVCSTDITQFNKKEKLALDMSIQLVLSETSCHGEFKEDMKKKGVIFYHPTTNIGNSGVYAIDWAASKGYEIYTAGIDFYLNEAENEDPARIEYMKLPMINSINKYIKTLKSHSDSTIPLGVFKFSERSRLECEVKVL